MHRGFALFPKLRQLLTIVHLLIYVERENSIEQEGKLSFAFYCSERSTYTLQSYQHNYCVDDLSMHVSETI